MRLSNRDAKEFYEIWFKLLQAINEKHNISPSLTKFVLGEVNMLEASKIRDYIWTHPESIEEVVDNYEKFGFNERELSVLEAWSNKHAYSEFVLVEHRSNHTIFMNSKDDNRLYAVHGIFNSLKKIYPARLVPIKMKTALIPFKNKIIYDGIFEEMYFDEDEIPHEMLPQTYREAKKKWGTSFTLPD